MPLRTVFEAPTAPPSPPRIAAGRTDRRGRRCAPMNAGAVPLSFAQRRLWFLDQLEGPEPDVQHADVSLPGTWTSPP